MEPNTRFLPADVIRTVIAYANHSIPEMRSVSKLWNCLVEEEYSKHSSLPGMHDIEIMFDGKGIIGNKRVRTAFKFMKKDENIDDSSSDPFFESHMNKITIRNMFESKRGKCITEFFNNEESRQLSRANGLHLFERAIDSEYCEQIISLTQKLQITRACLEIGEINGGESAKNEFLIGMAQLVDTLHIHFNSNETMGEFRLKHLDSCEVLFKERVKTIIIDRGAIEFMCNRVKLQKFAEKIAPIEPWLEINVPGIWNATPEVVGTMEMKVVPNCTKNKSKIVSHTWKHLVSQEYSKLSNLPPIDELEISTERHAYGNVIMAELKMRKGMGFALQEFHKLGYNLASETDIVVTSRKILYEVVLQNKTEAFSVIRKINRITLKEMNTRKDKLECIFRGIRSDNVQIIEQTMTDQYSEAVLKLIREWKVRKASFIVRNANRRTFLKEIAGCVYTLYFKQIGATSYLLGRTPDDRWLQTLVDMFGKRVTKIKVEHDNAHIIANHSVTKFFNEHFSKQSGRPWLEINAQREFRAHVTENGFVLDVVPIAASRCCVVKMKHNSRIFEPF